MSTIVGIGRSAAEYSESSIGTGTLENGLLTPGDVVAFDFSSSGSITIKLLFLSELSGITGDTVDETDWTVGPGAEADVGACDVPLVAAWSKLAALVQQAEGGTVIATLALTGTWANWGFAGPGRKQNSESELVQSSSYRSSSRCHRRGWVLGTGGFLHEASLAELAWVVAAVAVVWVGVLSGTLETEAVETGGGPTRFDTTGLTGVGEIDEIALGLNLRALIGFKLALETNEGGCSASAFSISKSEHSLNGRSIHFASNPGIFRSKTKGIMVYENFESVINSFKSFLK